MVDRFARRPRQPQARRLPAEPGPPEKARRSSRHSRCGGATRLVPHRLRLYGADRLRRSCRTNSAFGRGPSPDDGPRVIVACARHTYSFAHEPKESTFLPLPDGTWIDRGQPQVRRRRGDRRPPTTAADRLSSWNENSLRKAPRTTGPTSAARVLRGQVHPVAGSPGGAEIPDPLTRPPTTCRPRGAAQAQRDSALLRSRRQVGGTGGGDDHQRRRLVALDPLHRSGVDLRRRLDPLLAHGRGRLPYGPGSALRASCRSRAAPGPSLAWSILSALVYSILVTMNLLAAALTSSNAFSC